MDKPKFYFIIIIFSIFFVVGGLVKIARSLPLYSLYQNIKLGGVYIGSDNVYVEEIIPLSPADNAQLKVGDMIVSVNGASISKTNDFIDLVYKNRGKSITVTIKRDGEFIYLQLSPKTESLPGGGYAGAAISNTKLQKEPLYVLIPRTVLQDISWNVFTVPDTEIVVGPAGLAKGIDLQKGFFRPFVFLLGIIQIILAIGLIKLKKLAIYGMFILALVDLVQIMVYFSFMPQLGASFAISVFSFFVLALFVYYLYSQRKFFT